MNTCSVGCVRSLERLDILPVNADPIEGQLRLQARAETISDLAKPEVVKHMNRSIQSIGTAATITTASLAAVRAYGLDTLGFTLRPGTQGEWIEAYEMAIRENGWFVFPTWAPQYLNRGGRLRPIRDELGVLGGVNHGSLVSPKARWQELPRRTRAVLSNVSLDLDAVNEMDWLVNVEKLTARDAAKAWLRANDARVDAWFRV